MEASPLARLPPELRNRIYEFALSQPSPLATTWQPEVKKFTAFPPLAGRPSPLALTTTCRQVRIECLQLFYAVNDIVIGFEKHTCETKHVCSSLETMAELIGPANTAALHSLAVTLGKLEACSYRRLLLAVNALRSSKAAASVTAPVFLRAMCVHRMKVTFVRLDMQDLKASCVAVLEEVRRRVQSTRCSWAESDDLWLLIGKLEDLATES